MSKSINNNEFFLEFSDYQDSIAEIKANEFSNDLLSTSAAFLTEIFMDQIQPVVSEKYES